MAAVISQTSQMEWTAEHTGLLPLSHAKAQRGGTVFCLAVSRRRTRIRFPLSHAKTQRFKGQTDRGGDRTDVSRKGAKTQRRPTRERDYFWVLSLLSFFGCYSLCALGVLSEAGVRNGFGGSNHVSRKGAKAQRRPTGAGIEPMSHAKTPRHKGNGWV